jgi:hypothetical protein
MIGIEGLLELASVIQRLKEQSAPREGGAASPPVGDRRASRALHDPADDLLAHRMGRFAGNESDCGDSDAGAAGGATVIPSGGESDRRRR